MSLYSDDWMKGYVGELSDGIVDTVGKTGKRNFHNASLFDAMVKMTKKDADMIKALSRRGSDFYIDNKEKFYVTPPSPKTISAYFTSVAYAHGLNETSGDGPFMKGYNSDSGGFSHDRASSDIYNIISRLKTINSSTYKKIHAKVHGKIDYGKLFEGL